MRQTDARRARWLAERHRAVEQRYDRVHSPTYDERWGAVGKTHRRMLLELITRTPRGGTILDAACGTGKYWPLILQHERRVEGLDASAGMLAVARRKFPDVPLRRCRLQDLDMRGGYEAVMCVDAMELVPPEDWPLVLIRLGRALRGADGCMWLTVELPDPDSLAEHLRLARLQGVPVVEGEDVHDDGYHYYPDGQQVDGWLKDARLEAVADVTGDGYRHLLLRRAA